jgi:uncharacterized protein YqjF (DUF2071 family)
MLHPRTTEAGGGRDGALLLGDWDRVLMMHFAVDADALQRETPFALDLWHGEAFVSLVAFTMLGMRLRRGGVATCWLLAPIATHEFLNVRTYVRHGGQSGISFLAEWVPSRLSCLLGPRLFSLPYRLGALRYRHAHEAGELSGNVRDPCTGAAFAYHAQVAPAANWKPCASGSLDAWLMERYAAFNCAGGYRRAFRVWHEPWQQVRAEVRFNDLSLLCESWPWLHCARFTGANYSPGVREVGMGWPRRLTASAS